MVAQFTHFDFWAGDLFPPQKALEPGKIKTLGLSSQVYEIGYVEPATIKYLYQTCFAVVFPSLSEGWGFPAIEGMSMGKPVICSNLPSLKEVCGSSAIYIDPYQPESIADAVYNLYMNHDQYEDLVDRGQKHSNDLTWTSVAKQYQQLYLQLAE